MPGEIPSKRYHPINIQLQWRASYWGFEILLMGFNEFFHQGGSWTCQEIWWCRSQGIWAIPPPCHSTEIFTFCRVTEELVLKFLVGMQSKCSQGPDGISTKLLKLIIPHILSPHTHCFNLSFQQAFVASQFRSARVIPVYKSGKRDNYSNYRPISLLSSMCRLQERHSCPSANWVF